jgi:cobalt-zinc-cadmium efflux system outer membrane protein
VGVAGTYPNPSVTVGSSSQAAKLSGTVSVPLVVFGQRGAAIDAARADEATVALQTRVAWNDVRQAVTHAYVTLWLAEGVATARRDAAAIQTTLESAVTQRVQVGAAPDLDALRVRAERTRAEADVIDADAQTLAAATGLARWIGVGDPAGLRTSTPPEQPDETPPLSTLLARIGASAPVRRDEAEARAADVRAERERALVRPTLGLDLGADFWDPTLLPPNAAPGATPPVNYRAQLTLDVPLFNQRGGHVDREKALREVALARANAERIQGAAELTASYWTFEAATARQRTIAASLLPAAETAAKATEDAYLLGRAQLLAVLDANRALIDARVTMLEARAARATAWADVEHAVGAP